MIFWEILSNESSEMLFGHCAQVAVRFDILSNLFFFYIMILTKYGCIYRHLTTSVYCLLRYLDKSNNLNINREWFPETNNLLWFDQIKLSNMVERLVTCISPDILYTIMSGLQRTRLLMLQNLQIMKWKFQMVTGYLCSSKLKVNQIYSGQKRLQLWVGITQAMTMHHFHGSCQGCHLFLIFFSKEIRHSVFRPARKINNKSPLQSTLS